MSRRALLSLLTSALCAAALTASSPALAAGGQQYVAMADGTELAVWVQFPQGYDGHSKLPAIFEYDGYDGGAQASYYAGFLGVAKDYVTVHAGVRGAGCSAGEFSLFSEQQAEDGASLVEWIARQSWSDGNVGIYGHSYSATMGLLVAAQRPPHLRALTVDGVMDDLYRDLVYPGGVANNGFPILWLGAARPAQEYPAAEADTQNGNFSCLQHILQRDQTTVVLAGKPQESAYVQGELGYEDNSWWHDHAIRSVIGNIDVPLQITGDTQDEQTLSRGPAIMWQQARVQAKQLLLTNGDHNSFWQSGDHDLLSARHAWLDHYVRGIDNGIEQQPRVRFFFEGHHTSTGIVHTGSVGGSDFPLPQTQWQRFYANDAKTLTTDAPKTTGSDTYVSGTHRNNYDPGAVDSPNGTYNGQDVATADGPDQVLYRSAPFSANTAVAGPLVATLYATLAAPDAEFYVRVADEAPDGSLSLLNRGFLKASHRAIDADRSFFDGDVMYRPWHPHTETAAALITPGAVTRYDIEVWPLENVFRAGHRLVMIVSAPPVQEGYDTYEPRTAPGPVIINHDPDHPTNLLVPIVPTPNDLGPAVPCGQEVAVKCGQPGQIPNFPAVR